jgi:anti-sigma B factor antagonist
MHDTDDGMVVATRMQGGAAVVELDGELDLHTSPLLTDAVNRLLADGATTVEVDATGITFADSSGLCALLTSRRNALGAGAVIRLAKASQPLDRVLQMTGLDQVLTTGH